MSGFEEAIRTALSAVPAGDAGARQRVFDAARASLDRNLDRIQAPDDVRTSQREALKRTIARIEGQETEPRGQQQSEGTATIEPDAAEAKVATVQPSIPNNDVPPPTPASTLNTSSLSSGTPATAPTPSFLAFDPSIDTARRTAPVPPPVPSTASRRTFPLGDAPPPSPEVSSEPASNPQRKNPEPTRTNEPKAEPAPPVSMPPAPVPAVETALNSTQADRMAPPSSDLTALYDVSTGAVPPIDVSADRRTKSGSFDDGIAPPPVASVRRSAEGDEAGVEPGADGTLDSIVPAEQANATGKRVDKAGAKAKRSSTTARAKGARRPDPKGERRNTKAGKARSGTKAGNDRTKRGTRAKPPKRKGRTIARIASLLLVAGLGVLAWQWIDSTDLLTPNEPTTVRAPAEVALPDAAGDWTSVFVPVADDNAELLNEGGRTVLRVSGDTTLTLDGDELSALGSDTVRLAIAVRARTAQGGELAVSCRMGEGGCGRTRFPVQREVTELVLDVEPLSSTPALVLQPGLGGEAFTLDVLDVRARGL